MERFNQEWRPGNTSKQCLGSGSVGSTRFWLTGSGSGEICGSMDPDPRGKISTKNCIRKLFYSYNPNQNF